MKTNHFLITLAAIICCASCSNIDLTEEQVKNENKTTQMKILTRNNENAEQNFPLHIFAFDAKNHELKEQTTVRSATDNSELSLSAGNYHIVALSGIGLADNFVVKNVNSSIPMPESNTSATPVRMGSADVAVNQDATITLMLWNKVAAIDLTLYDIPSDATDVSTSLSLLNNEIQLNGTSSGQSAATVQLSHQGNNVWKAERFYTLPTNNNMLNMSISITTANSTKTYSFSIATQIEENTPYIINGSYEKGFILNNEIEVSAWNEAKTIDFKFGNETTEEVVPPAEDDDEPGDDETNTETFYVDTFPVEGDFWNNHFVAIIEKQAAEETAIVTLLSKQEWTEVPSALHTETPDVAQGTAETYTEGQLENWRIPTKEEAHLMCDIVGKDFLEITNATLEHNKLPTLSTGKIGSTGIRYLCNNAESSFVWDEYSLAACGAKRTYHLRVVKTVKLIKQ